MNTPLFSVVLPTRNRSNLLPFAIRSVLNQTFDDFEFIVSDNFSSDETPATVQSFDDERIKYFRSEKPLSLGDSCEFALSHAKGEFITFLSDDDAYSKIFLERLNLMINRENADMVSCRFAYFHGVDSYEYGKSVARQSLLIHPFDRRLRVFDRKEAVAALLANVRLTSKASEYQSFVSPRLVNSAYHHSLIEKLTERLPKIFPILGTDIYTSPLFLNLARKYCVIDEPLYVHCVWEGSTTSGEQSIFQKYAEERKLDYVPLKKLLSEPNYITNATLRAKSDWGAGFAQIPLDWSYYFISSYREIKYKQAKNVDVSEELDEFEQALLEQDEQLQKKVKLAMSGYDTITYRLRARLKDSILGNTLLKLKHQRVKVFDGFNDIAESAEVIDDAFLQKYAAR